MYYQFTISSITSCHLCFRWCPLPYRRDASNSVIVTISITFVVQKYSLAYAMVTENQQFILSITVNLTTKIDLKHVFPNCTSSLSTMLSCCASRRLPEEKLNVFFRVVMVFLSRGSNNTDYHTYYSII